MILGERFLIYMYVCVTPFLLFIKVLMLHKLAFHVCQFCQISHMDAYCLITLPIINSFAVHYVYI